MRVRWSLLVSLGWLVVFGVSAYERFIPASAYLEVRSVHVVDTQINVAPTMFVDRIIKADFNADWTADVELLVNRNEYLMVCTSSGSGNYATDNDLPVPLNLDWWTYPIECTPDVPGKYRVETTWRIKLPGGLTKEVRVVSNTFNVSEAL